YTVKLLQKLFGKKSVCQGVIGISFLEQGFAIAIAKYQEAKTLRLSHCEFVSAAPKDQQHKLNELASFYNLYDYDCHLVLTANDYRRINLEAPAVAEQEMNEALRWKITDLIEFPVSKAVLDYYPTPPSKRTNSGQMLEVIVSSSDVLKNQIEKCRLAQLQLKVIDIQETCLRNLAVLLPENERGVAILYLQEASGAMLIQKQATIYLYRKFEIGFKSLNLQQQSGNIDQAVHEQNNLALEIQRSMDYVESYYGIPPISSLVVIPLLDHTEALLAVLRDEHGITARIMDLTAIVDSDILLNDPTQSFCSPVIGATLRQQVAGA
ncbi:MAG: hypothetical protein ABL925_07285, partial [Methylococcales bacterium]